MEEMNQTPQAPQSAPGFLKTLVVLTYIFSSLGIIIFLIFLFASSLFTSMIPSGLPVESAAITSVLVAFFLIMIVFEIITMIGASKMGKLKKSGFWMWIIPNGLFLILLILMIFQPSGVLVLLSSPLFILSLLISIFMFVGYIANFKHLK